MNQLYTIAKADDTLFSKICLYWDMALLPMQSLIHSEGCVEGLFTLVKYIQDKPSLGEII